DVQRLVKVLDGFIEPASFTAYTTQKADRDPLAVAAADSPLNSQGVFRGVEGFPKLSQVKVCRGQVVGRPCLPAGVPELAIQAECLPEAGDSFLLALDAVGHAEVVEHPGLGQPVAEPAGTGQAGPVGSDPVGPVGTPVVEAQRGGGELPGDLMQVDFG